MIPTPNLPDETPERSISYCSIFWWGMFDKHSEGSRYMRRRMFIGAAFLAAGLLLAPVMRDFAGSEAGALIPLALAVAAAVWIATGFTRYLRYLDEMQRQLQYESIAITYGVIMAVAVVLGSLQFSAGWSFNPIYVILAEPIRGIALAIVTRRRA